MKNIYLSLFALLCFFSNAISQITSTPLGGSWSDPATWDGGVVPGPSDDVTIADAAVVSIDSDATINSLSVGQGTSGILEFESLDQRTLTVTGSVTVNNGAIFRSSPSGSQTGHVLNVGASLMNNGSLDFSTNGNTAATEIIFTGAVNADFSGAGIVTDVSLITIDKGNSPASVLELSTSSFTFKGASSTAGFIQAFLTILNGTFKISGTFTIDNGLFAGTGAYLIPETGKLWLNNPNYTINPRSGNANVEGTLQVDAGTYNVGVGTNDRLGYIAGSVVIINGGTVNVASRFSATSTFGISYTQTGGTFNVGAIGNGSGGRASFDIQDNDNSSFTMSGGIISVQNPGSAGSGPRDYFNQATNVNITGGTLQLGNALTAAGPQTFFISGAAPGVLIDNSTGGHTVQLFDNLTVNGNTTVNSGTTLNLDDGTNGFTYTQLGTGFTNTGTVNGTLPGSSLIFAGATAQTYGGDGILTSPLASLEINNAAGLTITNSVASDITALTLSLTAGDVNTGVSTLTLGTGIANQGIFNYTSGTIIGKFKRWFDAVTIASDFPVGIPGSTRNVNISFTSAPATGGTLTASWVSAYGGTNGLPLTEPGFPTVTNVAADGYWTVTAGDGFTGGVYDGTFTATNVVTVIEFTELVLVKRADGASPWVLDGTHVITTGSNTTPILSRTGMTGFSDFGIGGSTTSLPITVEYFKGSKQQNANLLDWKVTCTNTPTATMVLERSADSRKFNPLNTITATALRCLQPFSYTDVSPLGGINYYRIKLTDADGKSTYSSIIAILNKDNGFDIISMMPNPVTTSSILNIASAKTAKMDVVVTDISGKKIFRRSVNLVAGSNLISFDFSNFAPGVYQLTGYSADADIRTTRFIKN